MTKMDQMSIFEGEIITEASIPKHPTRAEKVAEWKKANASAYRKACDDNCTCTPTRAQMLLIQQYEGNGPADL